MPYWLDVTIKLLAAVLLGGIVGWQRETRERPAGLRTHILVCVGSAVYTLASVDFMGMGSDPARVAAQVATGMGFLGAGTIIRHGNVVRGLTTAASLWAVAAIGICAGMGGHGYWVGALATAIVLVTLTALHRAERRLGFHPVRADVTLRLRGGGDRISAALQAIRSQGATVDSFDVSELGPGGMQEVSIALRLPHGADLATMGGELAQMEGFVGMRFE